MRKSDEDRFGRFAREHAGPLRRSAYLLCGEWHLADALVQQTLIKIARRVAADLPPPPARQLRTQDPAPLLARRAPPPAAADPAAELERSATRDELIVALAALAPRQRAVLVLRFFESLTIAETADALGCSDGTVKSQTNRGLATPRAALAKELT